MGKVNQEHFSVALVRRFERFSFEIPHPFHMVCNIQTFETRTERKIDIKYSVMELNRQMSIVCCEQQIESPSDCEFQCKQISMKIIHSCTSCFKRFQCYERKFEKEKSPFEPQKQFYSKVDQTFLSCDFNVSLRNYIRF